VARDAVLETMRQEAEQIVGQARSQAAEITAQARRAAEEELRRAHQEGMIAARAQTENMLQMLATLVAETQAWQVNLMRRSERLTLELVQDIAARLFGDGFTLDSPTLSLTFERALGEAKSLGDLRVRVHPDDLAMLGELWPTHQTALRGQRIEMIPDLDIQHGGCFIDGQFGSVDGRVDTQMRLIRERLDQELADNERPEKAFVPFNGDIAVLSPEDLSA
jgi:flagellar assembly protein FliH